MCPMLYCRPWLYVTSKQTLRIDIPASAPNPAAPVSEPHQSSPSCPAYSPPSSASAESRPRVHTLLLPADVRRVPDAVVCEHGPPEAGTVCPHLAPLRPAPGSQPGGSKDLGCTSGGRSRRVYVDQPSRPHTSSPGKGKLFSSVQ